jgi:hypothetical protein
MENNEWIELTVVQGELIAESLRGLLEAQGISVYLNQEGAGRAYGLSVGSLGATEVLVRSQDLSQAQAILAEYEAGGFEDAAFSDDEAEDLI